MFGVSRVELAPEMQVQCVLYNVPLAFNMAASCLLPFMLDTVAFMVRYYAYVCRCRCRCVQVQVCMCRSSCAGAVAGVCHEGPP